MLLSKNQTFLVASLVLLYILSFFFFKNKSLQKEQSLPSKQVIITTYITPFDALDILGVLQNQLFYISKKGTVKCIFSEQPSQRCEVPDVLTTASQNKFLNNNILLIEYNNELQFYNGFLKINSNINIDKACLIKDMLHIKEKKLAIITCLNKNIKQDSDWIHKLYLLKIENNHIKLVHAFLLKDSYVPFAYTDNQILLYTDTPITASSIGYIDLQKQTFVKFAGSYNIFQKGVSILKQINASDKDNIKSMHIEVPYSCFLGISNQILLGLKGSNWEVVYKANSITSNTIANITKQLNILVQSCNDLQILEYTRDSTTWLHNGIITRLAITSN